MPQKVESRRFSRSPVHAFAEIRLHSGVLLEGLIRNASLTGVWFVSTRSLPLGNPVTIEILLSINGKRYRITSQGRVARVGEGGVAIEFASLSEDCAETLRQLMLSHSPSSEIPHHEPAHYNSTASLYYS
jgi:hypothetical protein